MKKGFITALQLLVGLGLIIFLLRLIDRSSVKIELATEHPVAIQGRAVYEVEGGGQTLVVHPAETGSAVTAMATGGKEPMPDRGVMRLRDGQGPDRIEWTACRERHYGLEMLRESFVLAGENWQGLLIGFALFFVCIVACTLRWQLLLRSQGLVLPLRRTFLLYFVGHFFNSFMFGSTGGDVVKAYYAAHEAPDRKAEAVSTVFIDRLMGMLVMVLIMVVVMLARLKLFLEHPETKLALLFGLALLLGTFGGLFVVLRKNVFEHYAFFRRLVRRPGVAEIIARVYGTIRFCMTRPVLLAQTAALSLFNQMVWVVATFFVGRAMQIDRGFIDYISVMPVVSAVGAIPLTPGGLGTREAATVALMGIFGVPGASAFTLSILLYSILIGWGLVGGVAYVLAAHKLGRPAGRG
jgi:uncharacterized protein (TIRG00374 family)